ncbi:MAG: hypothetical protein KatS3mg016_0203 [Fimbriimonadales bacterium]|nr:MAG: hypothetical protein KatS3mg016_0203 [Fimbriimonadales bacterium]
MPIIETVEQLAEFLEQNDEWRRKLFAILVPRSLQRMPEDMNEFREETRAEFKAVRQEMREGFERVDREMREGFERVDREMREGFERVDREMREGFERVDREFDKVRQEMREGFERVDREFDKVRQEMREGFERQGAQIKKNTDDIAELKGLSLETKFRNQAGSWFSMYLKKVRVVLLTDLEELLPEGQTFTEQEVQSLSNTDLFLFGVDKRDGRQCVYVVEVSWVVDVGDVERAVQRAQIVAQHGLPAAAVAAGRELTEGARERAQQLGCGLWINGQFQAEPMII